MNPIIEVLKTKDFKNYGLLEQLGMSMRWIEQIALGFYVYQITKDEFLVGLVFFLEIFLYVLFGAFIGVISDEFDKKDPKNNSFDNNSCISLLTISSFLDH